MKGGKVVKHVRLKWFLSLLFGALSLAALILVLSWIVPYIFDLFSTIQTLFSL